MRSISILLIALIVCVDAKLNLGGLSFKSEAITGMAQQQQISSGVPQVEADNPLVHLLREVINDHLRPILYSKVQEIISKSEVQTVTIRTVTRNLTEQVPCKDGTNNVAFRRASQLKVGDELVSAVAGTTTFVRNVSVSRVQEICLDESCQGYNVVLLDLEDTHREFRFGSASQNMLLFIYNWLIARFWSMVFTALISGLWPVVREGLYATRLKRKIDPLGIDWYGVPKQGELHPGMFGCIETFTSLSDVASFTSFFKEHCAHQKTVVIRNSEKKFSSFEANGKTDDKEPLQFDMVPVWRWGIGKLDYVFMSCGGWTDIKLYSTKPDVIGSFKAYIQQKYPPSVVRPAMSGGVRLQRQLQSKVTPNRPVHMKAQGYIDPSETIYHLHYPQRDELVTKLLKFQAGTLRPKAAHRYNLGIFLHGPPGCGKTSTVRAVCNLLGREMHVIQLKMVQKMADFEACVEEGNMQDKVIVFDEIDQVLNCLNDSDPSEEYITTNIGSVTKTVKGKTSSDGSSLDLLSFITWLDGAIQEKSRIIFATTNKPLDQFDSRLFRPGRFDYPLELQNCDPGMFVGISKDLCEAATAEEIQSLEEFEDWPIGVWSPCHFMNLCELLDYSPKQILARINDLKPDTYQDVLFKEKRAKK